MTCIQAWIRLINRSGGHTVRHYRHIIRVHDEKRRIAQLSTQLKSWIYYRFIGITVHIFILDEQP